MTALPFVNFSHKCVTVTCSYTLNSVLQQGFVYSNVVFLETEFYCSCDGIFAYDSFDLFLKWSNTKLMIPLKTQRNYFSFPDTKSTQNERPKCQPIAFTRKVNCANSVCGIITFGVLAILYQRVTDIVTQPSLHVSYFWSADSVNPKKIINAPYQKVSDVSILRTDNKLINYVYGWLFQLEFDNQLPICSIDLVNLDGFVLARSNSCYFPNCTHRILYFIISKIKRILDFKSL